MLKNWKTTVLGWLAAIVGVATAGWFKADGSINWMAVALGILVGLMGTFAKDRNVTGGTVGSTQEAQIRTKEPVTLPAVHTE